jgi:hypothetical protein
MNRLWPVALLGLASCQTSGEPRIIAETPASISYECIGTVSGCRATPQDIANAAQQHCQKSGKNAQQKDLGVAPSGNFRATFVCS